MPHAFYDGYSQFSQDFVILFLLLSQQHTQFLLVFEALMLPFKRQFARMEFSWGICSCSMLLIQFQGL